MVQTRQALMEQAARHSDENGMLHVALAAVMAGEHKMVGRFTVDGVHTLVYLVGAMRADGGTLLVKQTCGAQRPSYSVCGLEREHMELYRRLGTSDWCREMYNVTGNAIIVRNRMLAQEPTTVDKVMA
jgi:hypothetical protein